MGPLSELNPGDTGVVCWRLPANDDGVGVKQTRQLGLYLSAFVRYSTLFFIFVHYNSVVVKKSTGTPYYETEVKTDQGDVCVLYYGCGLALWL